MTSSDVPSGGNIIDSRHLVVYIDEDADSAVVEVEDGALDQTTDKSYSQGRLVRRRSFHHGAAMIFLIIFAFVALLAFTSIGYGSLPGWWKYNYTDTYPTINGGRPTLGFFYFGEHPFGQDSVGEDYFAPTMRGTQNSTITAFVVGLVGIFAGTVVGAIVGCYRGWAEAAPMRMTDLFIVIPLLVLAVVVGRTTGEFGIVSPAFMSDIPYWIGLARLVRGKVLSLREREFVSAARVLGASNRRTITRHILPSCPGAIIVSATLLITSVVLLETSLFFPGYGMKSSDMSPGLPTNQYQSSLATRPWLFFASAAAILIFALSVNLIGGSLCDAFDLRQRGKAS